MNKSFQIKLAVIAITGAIVATAWMRTGLAAPPEQSFNRVNFVSGLSDTSRDVYIDRDTNQLRLTDPTAGSAYLNDLLSGASLWDNVIVVAKGGGDYTTVQAAVDAASSGDTIIVAPGEYSEQVTITTDSLTLMGMGYDSHVTFTSSGNHYTSATLRIEANNTTILDLRASNPGDPPLTGGVAVGTAGSYIGTYVGRCWLDGSQDTLVIDGSADGTGGSRIMNNVITGDYDVISIMRGKHFIQGNYIEATNAAGASAPIYLHTTTTINAYIANNVISCPDQILEIGGPASIADVYWSNNFITGGGETYASPVDITGTWTGTISIDGGNVANWPSANTAYYTISGNSLKLNDTERISSAGAAVLTQANISNIQIVSDVISTTDTNADLNLEPDGTGAVVSTKVIKGASFNTGATERISSAGVATFTDLDVDTVAIDDASVTLGKFAADAVGGALDFTKSRHATPGSHTIVVSGDSLGVISAKGSNGTTYDTGAQINFAVDGTPGASADMPGRIEFLTSPDASATPAIAMTISQTGSTNIPGARSLSIGTDGTARTAAGLTLTGDFPAGLSRILSIFATQDAAVNDESTIDFITRTSNGSSSAVMGQISARVTATGTANTNMASALVFAARPSGTGSVTDLTDAMTIEGSGQVGIGASDAGARLEVQTGASEGTAAILIDQDDTDMPTMKIEGNSTASDPGSEASTLTTYQGADATVVGPKSDGTGTWGWAFAGMEAVDINGTTYYRPYYSWTSAP